MVALALLGLIAFGFLLGSIPFGLLVARLYGKDIRQLGSGNIGMTNVWRTLGWAPGVLVLVLDLLKGLAPTVASEWLLRVQKYSATGAYSSEVWYAVLGRSDSLSLALGTLAPLLVGLAAILGHTFTPWLRFKGGKGVATGLGVAIALFSWWILLPLAFFLVSLLLFRMVSVSSMLAALTLAIVGYFAGSSPVLFWFGILAFLLVLYTHRSNIRRILNGTENKVSFGRKSETGGTS